MTLPTPPPVSRRALTASALWAPPAISLATIAPAYAASTQPLVLSAGSYSAPNGALISGIVVQTNPPTAGQDLEVILSGGFAFERTTRVALPDNMTWIVTGTGGTATIPPIRVPRTGGTGTVTVTDESRTHSTSAHLKGPTTDATLMKFEVDVALGEFSTPRVAGNTPGTALPVGGAYWLDGTTVYHLGAAIATDVARGLSAYGTPLDAVTTSGRACTLDASGARTAYDSVPLGSTPVGCGYFLAGEDLYRGDELVEHHVRDAIGYLTADGEQCVDMVFSTDSPKRDEVHMRNEATQSTDIAGRAVAITLLGNRYFQLDTNLIHGSFSGSMSWEADKVVVYNAKGSQNHMETFADVVDTTGGALTLDSNGSASHHETMPAFATPVGLGYFVHGSDIYLDGAYLGSNVIRASTTCHAPAGSTLDAYVMQYTTDS